MKKLKVSLLAKVVIAIAAGVVFGPARNIVYITEYRIPHGDYSEEERRCGIDLWGPLSELLRKLSQVVEM